MLERLGTPTQKLLGLVLCLFLAGVFLAAGWRLINLYWPRGIVDRVPFGSSIVDLEKYLPEVRTLPTSVALLSDSEDGLTYEDATLASLGKHFTLLERVPYRQWVDGGRQPRATAVHIKFNYDSAPWETVFCHLYYINGRLVSRGWIPM